METSITSSPDASALPSICNFLFMGGPLSGNNGPKILTLNLVHNHLSKVQSYTSMMSEFGWLGQAQTPCSVHST